MEIMKKVIVLLCVYCLSQTMVGQTTHAERDAVSGQYGIKKNGKWMVNPVYPYAIWSNESNMGEVRSEKDGFSAIVNQNGKIITDFEYEGAYSGKLLDEGPRLSSLIVVFKRKGDGNLYGIIDRNGKIIVPCIYTQISPTDNKLGSGVGVTTIDNKHGLYDLDGQVRVEAKYANSISPTDFHLDSVKFVNIGGSTSERISSNPIGGKWGAIDKRGNEVVPCIYDAIEVAIYDSLYAVNKGGARDENGYTSGGKWGLYANGAELVTCQFDNAPTFKNDVATVKVNGQVKLLKNPLKDGAQIQIATGDKTAKKKENGPAVSRYPAPDSDVDKNIPMAKRTAENTFAFIIANENYPDAPVPYSLNDGRTFREYCQKTLGIPEKNINLYEDATFGNIITAVEKMKQVADAYDGEASVIFYYAGHGFPDDKQATAYLLPIDGDASNITTTGYSLAKLYKEISQLKLKSSVVFLDACFSGAKREDQMLASSRGVAIKVKEEAPQGNMVVFSAAQGDETAHQMEEKHHGLFTYFLLKELQATGGDVDMGTLTEYVTKQVKRQSVVINNKKQTPTVIPSQALTNNWQTMKLK